MKKSLWVFGIVMLAGAVFLSFTIWTVDREKGKVTVRETVLFGEPEQAAGLKVEMGTHWDSRLLWETCYEPGRTEEADSRFSFSAKQVLWEGKRRGFVYVDIPSSRGTAGAVNGNSGKPAEQEIDLSLAPMAPLLKAVADETAPGEERTDVLAVRDYLERYPAMMSAATGKIEDREIGSWGWQDGLEEILDLRVPEDAFAEVTIRKNAQGAVTGYWYTLRGGYFLTGTSAFGTAGCFYGFRRESREDSGIVRDGADSYLYFLPYMGGEKRPDDWMKGVDAERVVRVCALPAGTVPVELVLDEKEEYLYLAARDESRYYFLVYRVDGQSLTLQQQITILERQELPAGAESFWRGCRQMQVQEDGVLITWGGNLFVFLARQEGKAERGSLANVDDMSAEADGKCSYRVWCSGVFPLGEIKEDSENENSWQRLAELSVFADENVFAFDGRRLALAAVDRWGDLSTRLLVYLDGQPVYSGFYEYSGELDQAFGTWEGDRIQAQGAASGASRRGGMAQKPLRIFFEP